MNKIKKEMDLLFHWIELYKELEERETFNTGEFEEEILEVIKKYILKIKSEIEKSGLISEKANSLNKIKQLRPAGPRCLTEKIDIEKLENKILGAWIGRAAGCILGIPCEGLSYNRIKTICKNLKIDFPLSDYWEIDPKLKDPDTLHYETTPRKHFLKPNLHYIGADDDLIYTIIGLLVLEKYGDKFTTENVGNIWLEYLPYACTAEGIALNNLKKGISPYKAAEIENPFLNWIGADIRSDPWGYAAAGWPEKAAEFAYRDAFLSHRATGIHGEMFFSAVISTAFVVENPVEAIEIGLTEIPENCKLTETVKQTLKWCKEDKNWERTIERIYKKFENMSFVHTLNNAAITVAGLFYGNGDFEKTISLTVSAGMDTDCTGATAGSIIGAILGIEKIPEKWKKPLGNKVKTYLKNLPEFTSTEIAKRFTKVAKEILNKK